MYSKINYYIVLFITIGAITLFMNKWKSMFTSNDENDLIKRFLLNSTTHKENSLTDDNKQPIIWIHTNYAKNARKWLNFQSRNTTNLNQPYIHLTIKSIISHCNEDFKICLIDDNTFSQLLPSWEINMNITPDPLKQRYRELGMLQLLYVYGGLVLPNSFLCLKNLKDFYEENVQNNIPFVCEKLNNTNMKTDNGKLMFIPSTYIMGAPKKNATILEYIDFLKSIIATPHFSCEQEFKGKSSQWCLKTIQQNQMRLVLGERVGIKTAKHKKIVIEELFEENDAGLNLDPSAVGIYIPADEILIRPKYQWFSVMESSQILAESKSNIAKYLKTTAEKPIQSVEYENGEISTLSHI